MKDRWWSAPTEAESGRTIIVTGRDYLDDIRAKNKFIFRITVSWDYNSLPSGMPDAEDAALMEQVTDLLQKEFKKDKVAYMTGIYTGDGRRDWIFYASNLNIFGKVFNRALESLPTIPLVIEAESDPGWHEYDEMREISYIAENDEE